MSRYIGRYVSTCDMCLRTKASWQSPVRELHPLPIPDTLWDTISVDFIVELLESKEKDAVMVVVDSVTECGHFVDTVTTLSAVGMARFYVQHIWKHHGDEHTWLLPLEIALITLVYSSFKLIRAPAIIIILVQPLLRCCDHLFETKNYQRMLNWHFVVMTRIASRNYFVHKLALYQHSPSILEALDFNRSIFPQVLLVSLRWKRPSLMTKASQGQSPELLQQSVAFKLSYSKVLGAIVAPSFLGLFSRTLHSPT